MKVSTPSGRCGPCCSTAATGSTAIQRAVSAPAKSCQVISSQSRFGSMRSCPRDLAAGAEERGRDANGPRRMRRPPGMGKTARLPYFQPMQEKPMNLIVWGRWPSVLLASALAVGTAGAQTLDKVSFGTNWVAEAEHGGFYQALADGTYRKYGLDVTIVPGGPQVNNRILVPVGKMDFVMVAGTLQAFDAAVQNIPTVSVAAMFQKDPQVLLAHPDQGIEKFEDLKKLTLLVSPEGRVNYLQWLKADFGFREEQVKPYTFNPQPFLADKRTAMQGYVTSEPFAVEKQVGMKPKVFLLADYGYDTYSTLIETRRELTQTKPDLVQRFVDASIVGWYNYLYGDNKAANALIKKHNPEMSDELLAYSVETMKAYGIVDSGDALELGIGAMTDARMKSFFDKMVRAGVIKPDLDYRKSYTLQFVNKRVGVELRPKN